MHEHKARPPLDSENGGTSFTDCWLKKLPERLPSTGNNAPRAWSGRFQPPSCVPRHRPLGLAGWRQVAEGRSAASFRVPLLRRSDAREPRWDLHPGIQRQAPGYYDCKHSTFARGAFDAEVHGFLSVLEARFGRLRHPFSA